MCVYLFVLYAGISDHSGFSDQKPMWKEKAAPRVQSVTSALSVFP
jgi:hypothetical protein